MIGDKWIVVIGVVAALACAGLLAWVFFEKRIRQFFKGLQLSWPLKRAPTAKKKTKKDSPKKKQGPDTQEIPWIGNKPHKASATIGWWYMGAADECMIRIEFVGLKPGQLKDGDEIMIDGIKYVVVTNRKNTKITALRTKMSDLSGHRLNLRQLAGRDLFFDLGQAPKKPEPESRHSW